MRNVLFVWGRFVGNLFIVRVQNGSLYTKSAFTGLTGSSCISTFTSLFPTLYQTLSPVIFRILSLLLPSLYPLSTHSNNNKSSINLNYLLLITKAGGAL